MRGKTHVARLLLASAMFAAVIAISACRKNDPNAPAPWPRKEDTVYVSATLTSALPIPFTESHAEVDLPACSALTVEKYKRKPTWVMRDLTGGTHSLQGAWLPRMHRTKFECDALFAAFGEPKIVRSGAVHVIE